MIAKDDDATFGVLHCRMHEIWSLRLGTTLEDRPRYTSSTTFQTFPFPEGLQPTLAKPSNPVAGRIAECAERLVRRREAWLNPPEWVERVAEVVPGFPERAVAKPGFEEELARRTLTNLYNERPAWLDSIHKELDAAVAAAYGWKDYTPEMSDDEILERLFVLNQSRGRATTAASAARPCN